MKNIFKFETFQKNIIFVCLGIVLLTMMDYVNQISDSVRQLIEKDLMFLLLLFLLGLITDMIKETYKIYKKRR